MSLELEVQHGRRTLKRGDPISVKAPRKPQYSSGWTFLGWDPDTQQAEVRKGDHCSFAYVGLDAIRPRPVPRRQKSEVSS